MTQLMNTKKPIKSTINSNPVPPRIRALIKLHKNPTSIRLIVNWTHPCKPISYPLINTFKQYTDLPDSYNINSTTHLISTLQNSSIDQNTRQNMFIWPNRYVHEYTYKNHHKSHIWNLRKTRNASRNHTGDNKLTNLILDLNYLKYNDQYYKQQESLAMGAPTSAILSELYLQYLEHNEIYNILTKHSILIYSRYVDDILILYNNAYTNIKPTLTDFSNIHKNLQFTIKKNNNTINNLDLTIHRKSTTIQYNIHSNPSIYEQSVYEFSIIWDAQINTCFSICEPILVYMSSFLLQTNHFYRLLFSGSNGKLIFVLWVFALLAVLDERIKLVNWRITVL
jgi:hypothetical protein